MDVFKFHYILGKDRNNCSENEEEQGKVNGNTEKKGMVAERKM